jgi:hypothetical protein
VPRLETLRSASGQPIPTGIRIREGIAPSFAGSAARLIGRRQSVVVPHRRAARAARGCGVRTTASAGRPVATAGTAATATIAIWWRRRRRATSTPAGSRLCPRPTRARQRLPAEWADRAGRMTNAAIRPPMASASLSSTDTSAGRAPRLAMSAETSTAVTAEGASTTACR